MLYYKSVPQLSAGRGVYLVTSDPQERASEIITKVLAKSSCQQEVEHAGPASSPLLPLEMEAPGPEPFRHGHVDLWDEG